MAVLPKLWTPRKTSAQALPFKDYDEFLEMNDGTFRCIMRVSPINNELLADDENDEIVALMQEAINASAFNVQQITISSERMNLDEYMGYLEEKYAQTSESYYLERLNAMMDYIRRTSVRQRTTKTYYFTISTRRTDLARAREEFDEAVRKIEESLSSGEIYVKVLKRQDGLRMLYEKLNPLTSITQPFTPDQTIASIAPVPIRHFEDYSVMDNMYYRFYTIIDFPEDVRPAWMSKMLNVNAEIDVSIILQPTGKRKVIEGLDKSLGMIRYRLNRPGTRQSEKNELQKKEVSAIELIDDLSTDAENVFNTTVIVGVKERNLKDLEVSCDRVLTSIATSKMRARQCILMNNDPFWLTLPIAYPSSFLKHENMHWPMQSSVIGSILPFNSSDYMMNKGVVKGKNPATQSLVIVDRRDKRKVDNCNEVVIAPSGRGKSWYAQADISRENAQGTKCIIIDPDREYKFNFGERVVFSIGSKYCTNPFHIRSAILDLDDGDEEDEGTYVENVGQYLMRKIADIIPFFRSIYPKMDSTEEAEVSEAIRILYEEKAGLTFSSTELPETFPTLSDFDEICAREEFRDTLDTFRTNLKPYVSGIYKTMFNGQTNWSMDSPLTVLDINTLSEVVQPTMMYLLLLDIWEYIKRDRGEKKGLYVDEAWKLASPDNPQTLKFLFELAKRIRKYGGYLTTITQNVSDFFGAGEGARNYGQAIFDNAFFKMFLGLSEKDYKTLTDTGFTFSRKEERILKRRKSKGRGVYIIGSTRVEIQTTPLVDELRFIDPAEFKKLNVGNVSIDYSEVDGAGA